MDRGSAIRHSPPDTGLRSAVSRNGSPVEILDATTYGSAGMSRTVYYTATILEVVSLLERAAARSERIAAAPGRG